MNPIRNRQARCSIPIGRLPLTLIFLSAMVTANVLAGSWSGDLPDRHLSAWGISLDRLVDGELFRLVTGVFLSHDAGMFMRQLAFAATVIGLHEWRYGWKKTAAIFLFTDIFGTVLLFAGLIAPFAYFGVDGWSEIASLHDVGMSGGGFGLAGAIAVSLPRRWRVNCISSILLLLVCKLALYPDIIADSLHLITFTLGVAAGHISAPHSEG